MSENLFEFNSNRDAWATIRGFVYQVDQTILEWMSLKPGEVLELERGEDIDRIAKTFDGQEERTLSQVKHITDDLNLSRESVLFILLEFFLHKTRNPDLALRFRFLTNAGISIERPAIFTNGRKGILVWKELSNQNSLTSDHADLQAIKKLLKQKTFDQIQKSGTAAQTLQLFHDWLDTDELVSFIQSVNWSLEQPDATATETKLLDQLRARFHNQPSKVLYDRLFFFVFKTLTKPGIKRLLPEELIVQAGLPDLQSADKVAFENLEKRLAIFRLQFEKLKGEVAKHGLQLQELFGSVRHLETTGTLNYQLQNLPVNAPELISGGSLREKKVEDILKDFAQYKWIAFQGINGCGKTQLAALISRQYAHSYWLDLREAGTYGVHSHILLEWFLASVSGISVLPDRRLWIQLVVRSFLADTLIVLNDLPELDSRSPAFNNLLRLIHEELANSSVKLLSTSNHPLPGTFINGTNAEDICRYDDFSFSDEEIKDCLYHNNIEEQGPEIVALIAQTTLRNPRLTLAVIYMLKNIGQDRLVPAIINSAFTPEVMSDAQQAIRAQVPDMESRSLLYRLSLIRWEFNIDIVRAISAVEKPITFPLERFQDLIHIWVQHIDTNRYQISPLVRNLGKGNIHKEELQAVYGAFAEGLIDNRELNQYTAMQAILSFTEAGRWNDAGTLFIQILQKAEDHKGASNLAIWGFIGLWPAGSLPADMDLGIKANVRIQECRVLKIINKDRRDLLDEIDSFLDLPEMDMTTGVVTRGQIMVIDDAIPVHRYVDYLYFVVEFWSEVEWPKEQKIDPAMLSALFWFPLSRLTDQEDIKKWLAAAELAQHNLKINPMAHHVAVAGVNLLCNRIAEENPHNLELAELEQSRIMRLDLLSNTFLKLKTPALHALVQRELIHIRYIKKGELDHAEKAIQALLKSEHDAYAQFIYHAYWGRTLYQRDKLEAALPWLMKTIASDYKADSQYKYSLYTTAAIFQPSDTAKAVKLCIEALEITQRERPNIPFEIEKAWAESAIANWFNHDRLGMLSAVDHLAEGLYRLRGKDPDNIWKSLFQLSGHMIGYFTSYSISGMPPEKTDQPFFDPFIGMFALNNFDVSQVYDSSSDFLLATQLALLADALGATEIAYRWSLFAFDMARESLMPNKMILIASSCAHFSTLQFRPAEAFEMSLLFSAFTTHKKSDEIDGVNQIDLSLLLEQRFGQQWIEAEDQTSIMVIIPLFMQLLIGLVVEDEEQTSRRDAYFQLLRDQTREAADPLLFDLLNEISVKILENRISFTHLVQRANTFSDMTSRRSAHILCLLGTAFGNSGLSLTLQSLFTSVRYLENRFRIHRGLYRQLLVPFVRIIVLREIRKAFVGSREELSHIERNVIDVHPNHSKALQSLIKPLIELTDEKLAFDNQIWLNEGS